MVLIRLAGGDFKVPKRIFGQEIPITSRYGSRISPFHSKTIRSHRTKGLEKAQTTLNHDTNISNSRLIWNNLLHWTISQRTSTKGTIKACQLTSLSNRQIVQPLNIIQKTKSLGLHPHGSSPKQGNLKRLLNGCTIHETTEIVHSSPNQTSRNRLLRIKNLTIIKRRHCKSLNRQITTTRLFNLFDTLCYWYHVGLLWKYFDLNFVSLVYYHCKTKNFVTLQSSK